MSPGSDRGISFIAGGCPSESSSGRGKACSSQGLSTGEERGLFFLEATDERGYREIGILSGDPRFPRYVLQEGHAAFGHAQASQVSWL